jgi:hypothetical protein
MGKTEYGVLGQVHKSAKSNPSRTERILRFLESLRRRQTRSLSDPAPGSHFEAYRQRHELAPSVPFYSKSEESRPVSPEFSPPEFRPFSIALQSVTALVGSNEHSNLNGADIPDVNRAESEAKRMLDLRSYRFGQIISNRTEKDDEGIPQVTPANLETKNKQESQDDEPASPSRRDSLLANLRCFQSRMSAHGEKIGLQLIRLVNDDVLRDQNEELKRGSDELRKSNNPSVLINLGKLNDEIHSHAILLENLKIEPSQAFYTMAWLAVHQMNELESTTTELLSDMETNGFWDGKADSSIQSSAALSHRARVGLSKIAKEVNPRCERLITKLKKLALEAKMPRPPSIKTSVCPLCGKET